MEIDLKTGIIMGIAIVIPGIAVAPSGHDPVLVAAICAGLGIVTILGAVYRDNPGMFGFCLAVVALLGGYALMAGVVTGPAALGLGLLANVAVAALVVRAIPVRAPPSPVLP